MRGTIFGNWVMTWGSVLFQGERKGMFYNWLKRWSDVVVLVDRGGEIYYICMGIQICPEICREG